MKKYYFKLFLYFMFIFAFAILNSCSSSSGNSSIPTGFVGSWRGIYSDYIGFTAGSWTANIASNGSITGIVHSNSSNQDNQASGTVRSDGSLSLTVGDVTTGAKFTGKITGTQISGIWNNPTDGGFGNFTGTKQP